MRDGVNQYLSEIVLAVEFAAHLERHHDEIVEVLTRQESHETAIDELHRSVQALRGLHREMHNLREAHVRDVSAFLPINLPLYSLVLFAAIPSLMSERVFVRSPAVAPGWVRDVFEASGMRDFFPRVGIYDLQRREFLDHFVAGSDVVLFTGRYSNAIQVQRACSAANFVFNGAGVNPVVVGPTADVADVLDRIVTTRVFNSGQDCAGPDAFLVHDSVAEVFVELTRSALEAIPVGEYSDPAVRVGRILNPRPLPELVARLEELQRFTVVNGAIHPEKQIIEPRLIVRPIAEHDRLVEFFAPVFYVLTYNNDEELASFFAREEYRHYAMYVSVFGAPLLPEMIRHSNPLVGSTVLDVEHGNEPYGGWGAKANFVAAGDRLTVGPVLVSSVIAARTDRRGRGPLISAGEPRSSDASRSLRIAQ